MADLLLHLIVPAVALLAFYNRKYLPWIIILTPLTQLQAIDHIDALYEYNRALLHNVFTVLPFILIAVVGYMRHRETLTHVGIISSFYWASHIILDLDGVKVLWPLSTQVAKVTLDIPLGRPGQLAVMSASVHVLLVLLIAFVISLPNVRRELAAMWGRKPVDAQNG